MGPTASGKSEWALNEAEKNKGVIFNCDSVQLYKEVEVGAAKPSPQERKKVPHYLIDLIPAPEEITSAGYRRFFLEELTRIPESTPVYVVGGTGFYFLALEKGLYEIEEASPELKAELELKSQSEAGISEMLKEAIEKDPEYSAQKLHPNDHYRIVRAVEILRSNPGKTITELINAKKESKGLDGQIEKLGIHWEAIDLQKRIEVRTQSMLDAGLVDETHMLINKGLENWAPLKSVGYSQVVQYLKGQFPKSQLKEQIVIATRQLAKKQRTWFQRDKEIRWIKNS